MHVLFGYPGSGSAAVKCALTRAGLDFEQCIERQASVAALFERHWPATPETP